jgi:chromosome segregation ATPase
MDAKPMAQSGGNEEELRRLRLENQRLRAEGERVRLERDNAEARYTGSQTKVAELDHRVRTQSYDIDDLKAEVRTLRELSMESRRRDSIPPVSLQVRKYFTSGEAK